MIEADDQTRLSDAMATYRADINVEQQRGRRRKSTWVLATLLVFTAFCTTAFFLGRNYMLDGLPDLPDKQTMWQFNVVETITVLDENGRMLGHRGPWLGRPLKLDEMPAHLPNAVLAIEDERFFEHEGVDNRAIMRAMVNNFREGERGQGGSTLTQQLVKTMLLTPEKTYRRKVQEAILARDMEAVLSKPEILELYMNRISLGPQIFGVEAAAQRFFGKSAADVSLAEAAMIAGLAQAPSRYNPQRHYETALRRSQTVLSRMIANGMITEAQRAEAIANPPEIVDTANDVIDANIMGYAFDFITKEAQQRAGLKHKDLVVTVTLNAEMMAAGHDALSNTLEKSGQSKKASEGSLVAIDNKTGAVLAMIGGRDYANNQFNRAVQAQRQPGSSFKAFVYAAALQEGFTPATVRVDQPTNIGGWEPENYTERYRGPMTVREALKLSINTVAAQIGSEIGPSRVAQIANQFGIQSTMRPELSLSLGSSEVNLLELTGAYTVFANEGLRRRPHMITRIENTSGDPIYTYRPSEPTRVYPLPYARQMTSMLRDTVETGTAYGAKLGRRPAAGKTGTSQDYRDAWFIGFTNQITTGVWIGNDDNSPMRNVTGGLLPADTWKAFMLAAHKGKSVEPLAAPDPLIDDEMAQQITAYYEGLALAMTQERDLAAGVGGASAGR
jgi:penicillin-binding protein 1A